MKKKMIKIGLTALLLLTMLATAVTASAEDNGYWTTKTDASGNTVMIYTYTQPVEWTINEQSGYGQCGNVNPGVVSKSSQDNSVLSANAAADAQTAVSPAEASVNLPKTKPFIIWSLVLPILAAIFGTTITAVIIKKSIRRRVPAVIRTT